MPKFKLKAARINAGLTQAEAAEKLGVSISTLKKWESKNNETRAYPKQPQIEKLCSVYGIPYDYIDFE